MNVSPVLSVVIPVAGDLAPLRASLPAYAAAIAKTGIPHEFLIVLDGTPAEDVDVVLPTLPDDPPVRRIRLVRPFGESIAAAVGASHARGTRVLFLPVDPAFDLAGIPALVAALDSADVAAGDRGPSVRGLRGLVDSILSRLLLGLDPGDQSCGAIAARKEAVAGIALYGDRLRLFPLLAALKGYRVESVPMTGKAASTPTQAARRATATDLLALLFLTKFTHRPLRFFGPTGAALFSAGTLLCLWLLAGKFFLGEPLANRPLLLLGVLLVVLGAQIVALGLIGEIVVYTHARHVRDYEIAEIVE